MAMSVVNTRKLGVNNMSIRKYITEDEFNSLKPFDKMAHKASDITNLDVDEYWFQVSFEITVDCPRHGFAVLEAFKR